MTRSKKELFELLPTQEVFKESFSTIEYKKNAAQARELVRYVLDAVNSHWSTTNEHLIDRHNVNIEHVLPQAPDETWGVSKKEIAGYVNRIGNLTLVDKRINSAAGNESLERKLEVLSKSELSITNRLVDEIRQDTSWGEERIPETREAAELAYQEVWRIPMPNQ